MFNIKDPPMGGLDKTAKSQFQEYTTIILTEEKLNLKYIDLLWTQRLIVLKLTEAQLGIQSYEYWPIYHKP